MCGGTGGRMLKWTASAIQADRLKEMPVAAVSIVSLAAAVLRHQLPSECPPPGRSAGTRSIKPGRAALMLLASSINGLTFSSLIKEAFCPRCLCLGDEFAAAE
jgi:hypothetical protein